MSTQKFKFLLRANKEEVRSWLLAVLIALIAGAAALKLVQLVVQSWLVLAGFVLLYLMVFLFGGWLVLYFGRLLLSRGTCFDLNDEGLIDHASFLAIGYVDIQAVGEIRFRSRWGYEWLVVQIKPSVNPIVRGKSWLYRLYRLIFGSALWVPVPLFNLSRQDMESQILHLDRMMRHQNPSRGEGQPGLEFNPNRTGDLPVYDPPTVTMLVRQPRDLHELVGVKKVEADSGDDRTMVLDDATMVVPADGPPPLSEVAELNPDKQRIKAKVEQIRREIRESGFDHLVANLFIDHIAFFPELAKSNQSLPDGILLAETVQSSSDYNEVAFRYADEEFRFGLRRDIGASDEALLSLGVGGRVVMLLKVKVEIGQLEPLELESFLEGPWQEKLKEIKGSVDRWVVSRLGPEAEITTTDITATTQTKTNLEDLKNRFGLRD